MEKKTEDIQIPNQPISTNSLLDHNKRVIPQCNVITEGEHVYIREPEEFMDSVGTLKSIKISAILTSVIFFAFFIIFTLNFGTIGWSAGNIITFVLVVSSLLLTLYYTMNWTEMRTLLKKIKNDGTPCLQENIVYCKK